MATRTRIATLALLLSVTFAPQLTAGEIKLDQDGWYRWEVAAGAGGEKACCYRFNNGNVQRVGCRLGHGMDEFDSQEPCDIRSDSMQIYVEVRDGRVREIRPLSSACPVRSETDIRIIEDVTTADSIAWLKQQVNDQPALADEAIMALSFHTKEVALQALFDLLENRDQWQETREEALFWLIQSDYDEAFVYLDRLLD